MTTLKIRSPLRRVLSVRLPRRLLPLPALVVLCLTLNTVGAGAQTADDHGNTFGSATPLALGTSLAGRIDPGNDVDVFKLDLSTRSGITDVWMYTTGELDTKGGLYDVDPRRPILWNDDSFISGRRLNFHLRASLAPGTYYVGVFSYDRLTTGDYVIHAETVIDPGNTISTATNLSLSDPTAGSIGFAGDNDYFKLDLAATTHVYLYARSVYGQSVVGYPVDTSDRFVPSNTHIRSDGFFVRDQFGPGTYYIKVFTLSSTSHPVPYTIHAFEETSYPRFLEDCQAKTAALNNPQINDALYGCQWHLNNAVGEDINVEPVWAEGTIGEGINIVVVDDGMDWRHEDLVGNVSAALNHDYTDNNDIHHPFEHHGTNVAGIIAARDNGVGVRGVAPRATMYGYNYLAADRTEAQRSDAMTRNAAATAVSNNSWGPRSGPGLSSVSAIWEMAIEYGVRTGYNGKGIFYAFAGGNGHPIGDNSNLSEIANYYGVTSVCAVNDSDIRTSYSELGANLWVCAPSGEASLVENREIITTENYDRYVYNFSGTSAATPIVSGVAALMRQANPNLTWRDLKLILAASARKNDPTNSGWKDGARKYGSASATDLYHFNHEYGFGVVDAKAAVDMAKTWPIDLPSLQSATAESGNLNVLIPDATTSGPLSTITHDLSLNTDVNFTEFVEVDVTFNHPSFRDLDIKLISPSGSESQLTVPFNTYTPDDPTDEDFIPLRGSFRLGSSKHLGEDPNGVWQLRVTDRVTVATGQFQSWRIKVYGHSGTLPDTSQCTTGDAVSNAPGNSGLVSDCETLLSARDRLEGTGTSLNWSASTPMSDWDGVALADTPERVTQLSLWNRGLRGTIPDDLGNLTALKSLNLSTGLEVCDGDVCRELEEHERNTLTGVIPASLGNLSNLESLSLTRNRLTGAIPAELGGLSRLTLLALGGNELTGTVPPQLGNLTNLEGLYLWGNQLTGHVPSELGSLQTLKWLELGSNQLSGGIPATLGSLSNLERLTLYENQISGQIPAQLGNLQRLKQLSLWDNQISGVLPVELGSLSNLEELWLARNQLTGQIPETLGSLTNLRELSLSSNQLTGMIPSSLVDLNGLEEMWLSQNQLTGEIPETLGNLTNLRELSLWSNQLTGAIPASLVRLTSLEKLYLSQNMFTGCIPASLQSVPDNDLASVGLSFCVAPSVVLNNTSAGAPVRIDSAIQVTATFSEPVTGFESADITVANGSVSNFAGSDGNSVYTFDVLPNAVGEVTVDIAGNVAVDAEGNGNTAAVQLSVGIPYDDDHDGSISRDEVLTAIEDYLSGNLTSRDHVLDLITLYLSG